MKLKNIIFSESTDQTETIQVKNTSEILKNFTGIAEFPGGTKYWYKNGKRHRENDLPAIEYANGTKHWYLNGKIHRETGPAIEQSDGTKEWWLNNKRFWEEEWKKLIKKKTS